MDLKIYNYLLEKIEKVNKLISNNNLKPPEIEIIIKKQTYISNLLTQYLNNIKNKKNYSYLTCLITISRFIFIIYKLTNVSSCIIYRSVMILLLLKCKNNKILKDFQLISSFINKKDDNISHAILILNNNKNKYLIDPLYKKIIFINNKNDFDNYLISIPFFKKNNIDDFKIEFFKIIEFNNIFLENNKISDATYECKNYLCKILNQDLTKINNIIYNIIIDNY